MHNRARQFIEKHKNVDIQKSLNTNYKNKYFGIEKATILPGNISNTDLGMTLV